MFQHTNRKTLQRHDRPGCIMELDGYAWIQILVSEQIGFEQARRSSCNVSASLCFSETRLAFTAPHCLRILVNCFCFHILHVNRFILRCPLRVQWSAADPHPLFSSETGLGRSDVSTCGDATRGYVGTPCRSYKARRTMTGCITRPW